LSWHTGVPGIVHWLFWVHPVHALFPPQIGVGFAQVLLFTQPGPHEPLVEQTGVPAGHWLLFVQGTHAPVRSHTGVFGLVHCELVVHGTHDPLLQIGVVPPHWVFVVQGTHAPLGEQTGVLPPH
jgi:hypothetical protein